MTKTAIRFEDMSAQGQLRVTLADDGDVLVSAMDNVGNCVTVEFCSIGAGGGRSPRTNKALRDLFVAMALDNEDPACAARRALRGAGVDEALISSFELTI